MHSFSSLNQAPKHSSESATPQVMYWSGQLGGQQILNQCQQTLLRLLQGEGKSLVLEKLKLNRRAGHPGIYSARIIDELDGKVNSRENRLIFTTHELNGQKHILVLDIVRKHRYDQSRAFRRDFLDKIYEGLPENTNDIEQSFSETENDLDLTRVDPSKAEIHYKPTHYNNHKFVILDSEQREFELDLISPKKSKSPRLIVGGPGTGKSLLAQVLMRQASDSAQALKILYLTSSPRQCEDMREDWKANKTLSQIEMKTGDDFVRELAGEHVSIVGIRDFNDWFKKYLEEDLKNLKPKGKGKQKSKTDVSDDNDKKVLAVLQHPNDIYEEFLTISGLSKDEYAALKDRECLFVDNVQKDIIYQLYESYMSSLQARKDVVNPQFYDFVTAFAKNAANADGDENKDPETKIDEAKPDLVVVDEGQVFSRLFLLNSAKLSKSGKNVIYLIDPNQSGVRRQVDHFLLKAFNEMYVAVFKRGSKRCPHEFTELATVSNLLKNYLAGGVSSKLESVMLSSAVSEDHHGYATYHDPEDISDIPVTKSREFVIITRPEYRDEAIKRFGTGNVLTPTEARGIEIKTVVIYRFCDAPRFYQANKALHDMGGEGRVNINRAKEGVGDDSYNKEFQDLYVALTRATHRLYFVEKNTHELANIVQPFITKIAEINEKQNQQALPIKEVVYENTSDAAWKEEQRRHDLEGHHDAAQAIAEMRKDNQQHASSVPVNDALPDDNQTSSSTQITDSSVNKKRSKRGRRNHRKQATESSVVSQHSIATDITEVARQNKIDEEKAKEQAIKRHQEKCDYIIDLLTQLEEYRTNPFRVMNSFKLLFTSHDYRQVFLDYEVEYKAKEELEKKRGCLLFHISNRQDYISRLTLCLVKIKKAPVSSENLLILQNALNLFLPIDEPAKGLFFQIKIETVDAKELLEIKMSIWLLLYNLISVILGKYSQDIKFNPRQFLTKVSLGDDTPASILHYLCLNINSENFGMLLGLPELFNNEQMFAELFNNYVDDEKQGGRIIPYVIFTKNGMDYLDKQTRLHPHWFRKYCTADVLMSQIDTEFCNADNDKYYKVRGTLLALIFLQMFEINRQTSIVYGALMREIMSDALIKEIKEIHLCDQAVISIADRTTSKETNFKGEAVKSLATLSGGFQLIVKLLKNRPDLAKSNDIYVAIQPDHVEVETNAIRYNHYSPLFRETDGCELLTMMLSNHPDLGFMIMQDDLILPIRSGELEKREVLHSNPIIYLNKYDAGKALLAEIKKACPHWADLIDKTLNQKTSQQTGTMFARPSEQRFVTGSASSVKVPRAGM